MEWANVLAWTGYIQFSLIVHTCLAASTTSVTSEVARSLSPTRIAVNSTPTSLILSSSLFSSVKSPEHNPNEDENETVSAPTDVEAVTPKPPGLHSTPANAATRSTPTSPTSGTNSQLAIGLGMGFGFTIGLIASICIIWKVTCRLMSSTSAASNNKIAPGDFSEAITKDRPIMAQGNSRPTKPPPSAPTNHEPPADEDDLYDGDYEIR